MAGHLQGRKGMSQRLHKQVVHRVHAAEVGMVGAHSIACMPAVVPLLFLLLLSAPNSALCATGITGSMLATIIESPWHVNM
jgi:hypothetical protein